MNVRSIRRALARVAFASLVLGGGAWSGTSLAGSACLKGAAPNKVCVDLRSVPSDTVQPSMMAGSRTFVRYSATMTNLVLGTSRNVALNLTFTPTPPTTPTVDANAAFTCTTTANAVSCIADKLNYLDTVTVTATAEAPTYPTTVTQMIGTAVFGWNGNTASTNQTVAVSNTSGTSYVPAGKSVTLATSDSSIIGPDHPRYASVQLPPQADPYEARLSVIEDAPVNTNCVAGIYLSPVYGGPFLCRDLNDPTREVLLYTSFLEGDHQGEGVPLTKESPGRMRLRWDASLMQSAQLAPNPPLAPTGLPPFALFTTTDNGAESDPLPPSAAYAAIWNTCGGVTSVEPPCLVPDSVTVDSDGDWQADSLLTNPLTPPGLASTTRILPLRALYEVLNKLVPAAEAQILPSTKIMS